MREIKKPFLNKKNLKHFAFIPARECSKGLPMKNRILLSYTLDFIKKLTWIKKTYIFSDDKFLKKKINRYKDIDFIHRKRSESYGNESIKSVFKNFLNKIDYDNNSIFWLFYLTIPQRKLIHFNKARNLIDNDKVNSIISFIDIKTHPFDCWIVKNNKIKQKLFKHDSFRRQDKPLFYEHHHYICALSPRTINKINSELISEETYPFILEESFSKNLIEIDTKNDLKNFQKINIK